MHQPANAASSPTANILAALRRLRFAIAQSKIDWHAVRHFKGAVHREALWAEEDAGQVPLINVVKDVTARLTLTLGNDEARSGLLEEIDIAIEIFSEDERGL